MSEPSVSCTSILDQLQDLIIASKAEARHIHLLSCGALTAMPITEMVFHLNHGSGHNQNPFPNIMIGGSLAKKRHGIPCPDVRDIDLNVCASAVPLFKLLEELFPPMSDLGTSSLPQPVEPDVLPEFAAPVARYFHAKENMNVDVFSDAGVKSVQVQLPDNGRWVSYVSLEHLIAVAHSWNREKDMRFLQQVRTMTVTKLVRQQALAQAATPAHDPNLYVEIVTGNHWYANKVGTVGWRVQVENISANSYALQLPHQGLGTHNVNVADCRVLTPEEFWEKLADNIKKGTQ